ncbi:MAG: DNA recombination protein RmuC [Xanthomonadales bacterium]|nr:DNA recombination protein RmuC [Xanthomonadales bacterium]
MDVASVLIGIFIGAALVAAPMSFWAARNAQRRFDAGRASRDGEFAALAERLQALQADLHEERTRAREAAEARAALAARIEESTQAQGEKLRWIDTAREHLGQQFQTLATAILEAKSERFSTANAEQLGALMAPLREQLQQFQQLVVESRAQEGESRAVLRTEIVHLRQMSERLSGDALNLTRALTGDSKSQGAWGELVLERLLEASGLCAGRDFETQVVLRDEGSEVRRPDVIVRLPGGRDVVIDAKVSLTAFERWCNEVDATARERHLAEHVGSMRRHVDDLGRRGYANSSGLASNGIVLMFVPIEAAYLEAIRVEPKLYELALRSDVVVVSPGMLLGMLRTIDHVWKAEARQLNAEKIAERAGLLYDKFVALIQDLQRAAEQVGKAREGIDAAISKLGSGRGHLLGQVEKLKQLGARSSRDLRSVLPVHDNGDDDPEEPLP